MNFIDEQDRFLGGILQTVGSLSNHAPNVGDIALHAAQSLKPRPRRCCNDLGKTRLPHARRAIQDYRGYSIRLNCAAQELAGTENVALANNFVQCARTHPRG